MNGVIVMLRILSYAVYIFLQCTWGIIQTLMGLVYFLISIRFPHDFYHGYLSDCSYLQMMIIQAAIPTG